MSRRFTFVTVALTAVVAFLVGAIFAGGLTPSAVVTGTPKTATPRAVAHLPGGPATGVVNFADVVERLNPAVVNIDATARGHESRRRRSRLGAPAPPDLFDGTFDLGTTG